MCRVLHFSPIPANKSSNTEKLRLATKLPKSNKGVPAVRIMAVGIEARLETNYRCAFGPLERCFRHIAGRRAS